VQPTQLALGRQETVDSQKNSGRLKKNLLREKPFAARKNKSLRALGLRREPKISSRGLGTHVLDPKEPAATTRSLSKQ
jgi:hypothetical protein